MAEGEAPVRIDVWSDVVCPYCYVGKRHIEAAIARAETAVEITYRAFQLHPQAPADQSMPIRDFENFTELRPGSHQVLALDTLLGEVIAWSEALAPLRRISRAA